MSEARLPDFIVVGAPAAGTHELALYMNAHPQISVIDPEVEFFASERSCTRGLAAYGAQFATESRLLGEHAPGYARFPQTRDVPERIRSALPEVKLIFVMRDPIERVMEQYANEVAAGREDRSIRAALAMLKDNPYIDHGRYHMQLEQFWKAFPPERIHLLTLDALQRDPSGTLSSVYRFLGANANHFDASVHQEIQANRSASLEMVTPAPQSAWQRVRALFEGERERPTARPKLDVDLRARLEIAFADDLARLRDATSLDLSRWKV